MLLMSASKFAVYSPGTPTLRQLRTIQKSFSTLEKMAPSVDNVSERYCFDPSLIWNPQVEGYFVKAYGAEHFARISKSLTRPSCYSCIRVNTLKTTTDSVIQKLQEMLQATNSAEGKVHQKNAILDSVVRCPITGLDYVVFVHGTGPHEIEYQPEPGKPLKEVIVSRKCAEAVLRGAQIFVPGILACSAHVEKGDTVAVSVAIEQPEQGGKWGTGITRGIILQGLETDCHYFQRKGLYIGQGTTMMSRAGIFRALQGVAICMKDRVYDLPSFNNVMEGEIFLQNLPSIITAHVLDPQRGERVIDMCAAPGGKTTAIAMRMKDEGVIVAVDRSHNKVQGIQELVNELGLKSIIAYKLDALKSVSHDPDASKAEDLEIPAPDDAVQKKNNGRIKNGPGKNHVSGSRVAKSIGFAPNSFDRVLLDAPCSALGLRPRLLAGEETLESLRGHGRYQRKMFDQAVQLVKPGGVIVYSTCTLNPGENEALVRYALNTYKFLTLAKQDPKVGGPGLVGGFEFGDGFVEEWLRPGEEDLVQRFDPSVVDTIGFFIAKFNVGSKDV